MSNRQSIRDELVQILDDDPLFGRIGYNHAESLADRFLDSPVIRRIQAEALREAAHELWRVTKDCDEHCDDDWRYRLESKADAIERGETA